MQKKTGYPFIDALQVFVRKMKRMIFQPVFLILSFFGNLLIISGSALVYHFEYGINPNITHYLDSLWWAVSTVTTVGYGDVTPITQEGRIVGIFMMIIGIAMFWSYTALFAEALLSKEIDELETSIQHIEKMLKHKSKHELDEIKIQNLIATLQKTLESRK